MRFRISTSRDKIPPHPDAYEDNCINTEFRYFSDEDEYDRNNLGKIRWREEGFNHRKQVVSGWGENPLITRDIHSKAWFIEIPEESLLKWIRQQSHPVIVQELEHYVSLELYDGYRE